MGNVMRVAVVGGVLALSLSGCRGTTSTSPSTRSAKQSNATSANQVVDEAGFQLKAAGMPEVNDWAGENPVIRLAFSIERQDRTAFSGLSAADVGAEIGGRALPGPAIDLRTKNSADTSVILVIDTSGSMLPRRAAVARQPFDAAASSPGSQARLEVRSIDKLTAAKGAMQNFLNGLKTDDKVAIVAFDETPRLIHELSADKAAAREVLDGLHVNPATSRFTALYTAMQMAVEQARAVGARNVIFLTDGMEDTPEFRAVPPEDQAAYKAGVEQRIAGLTRVEHNDIRIFTVGLGDPKAPVGSMSYVDNDTLNQIASLTNAGRCACINLAELAGTVSTAEQYGDALTSRLSGVLDEVSKTFHYDYTLTLHPDRAWLEAGGSVQKVRIVPAIGDPATGRVHLPVEFTFTQSTQSRPTFGEVAVLAPIFIRSVDPKLGVLALTKIYLAFVGALGLLATFPSVLQAVDARKEVAAAKHALVTVREGSPYIGLECPNERNRLGRDFLFRPGDVVVVCPNPSCNTAHHVSCWHATQDTCWVRTCGRQLRVPSTLLRKHGLDEV